MKQLLFSSLLACVLLSCGKGNIPNREAPPPKAFQDTLTRVKGDAVADAEKSFQLGDYRFLAVQSFRVLVHGVETEEQDALLGKYGMYILEGTSDYVESEIQLEIYKLASGFTKRYNIRMIQLLESIDHKRVKR